MRSRGSQPRLELIRCSYGAWKRNRIRSRSLQREEAREQVVQFHPCAPAWASEKRRPNSCSETEKAWESKSPEPGALSLITEKRVCQVRDFSPLSLALLLGPAVEGTTPGQVMLLLGLWSQCSWPPWKSGSPESRCCLVHSLWHTDLTITEGWLGKSRKYGKLWKALWTTWEGPVPLGTCLPEILLSGYLCIYSAPYTVLDF